MSVRIWREIRDVLVLIIGVLMLAAAVAACAGCGVVDEMIANRGGDVRSAEERAEDLGVPVGSPEAKGAPEHVRETGEFITQKGAEAPGPLGTLLWSLGSGVTALGVAWQGYRRRRDREVGTQATIAGEFRNGLQTMVDYIDSLPPDLREKLVPALQDLQKRRGTRNVIRAVRSPAKVQHEINARQFDSDALQQFLASNTPRPENPTPIPTSP